MQEGHRVEKCPIAIQFLATHTKRKVAEKSSNVDLVIRDI